MLDGEGLVGIAQALETVGLHPAVGRWSESQPAPSDDHQFWSRLEIQDAAQSGGCDQPGPGHAVWSRRRPRTRPGSLCSKRPYATRPSTLFELRWDRQRATLPKRSPPGVSGQVRRLRRRRHRLDVTIQAFLHGERQTHGALWGYVDGRDLRIAWPPPRDSRSAARLPRDLLAPGVPPATANTQLERLIRDYLRPRLREAGFSAAGGTFRRMVNGNWQIVNLQRSRHSPVGTIRFAINLGVASRRAAAVDSADWRTRRLSRSGLRSPVAVRLSGPQRVRPLVVH
jgi:hypothetical protein